MKHLIDVRTQALVVLEEYCEWDTEKWTLAVEVLNEVYYFGRSVFGRQLMGIVRRTAFRDVGIEKGIPWRPRRDWNAHGGVMDGVGVGCARRRGKRDEALG